jgi:Ser/Thr protein kinase RdoA (MazF antagonist)
MVENLLERTSRFELPDRIAVTACHGDMTLENIVVTRSGGIVFIDLLDSFFEHGLADFAKLDQDLSGGWYARKSQPLPISLVEHVRRELCALGATLYPEAFGLSALLTCIHFARIIPYAKQETERDFVTDRLEYLLNALSVDGSYQGNPIR